MKAKLMIVFFSLISGITLAGVASKLDSLRKIILAPKLREYHITVTNYTASIKNTNDKLKIKLLAKQIIVASNALMEEIRELYGYKNVSKVNPVYIGANVQTSIYPNIGGYIFPTTYTTVGSLPNLYEQIEYIKDYAWRIRLHTSPSLVQRNIKRIDKRNLGLVEG